MHAVNSTVNTLSLRQATEVIKSPQLPRHRRDHKVPKVPDQILIEKALDPYTISVAKASFLAKSKKRKKKNQSNASKPNKFQSLKNKVHAASTVQGLARQASINVGFDFRNPIQQDHAQMHGDGQLRPNFAKDHSRISDGSEHSKLFDLGLQIFFDTY